LQLFAATENVIVSPLRNEGDNCQSSTMLDPREASCACGTVRVIVRGSPAVVNACACLDCQRRSGSSFTYTAFYPNDAVRIEGETRTFRTLREAGRWHDASFCVQCGVSIVSRLEVFPHLIGVAVGCFGDPGFDAPGGFYWAKRRHRWLGPPAGVRVVDAQ
jgi:hypothetical protein